jgi:signal peptidase II
MRTWGVKLALLLVVVIATVGCDQVSKRVASTHLMGGPPRSYLGGSVRLEYAENTGGFLSLGEGLPSWARTALFSIGNGALLIACAVSVFSHRWRRLALLGLCLIFAGGVSNLVDRFAHGRVVDFLNVGIGPVRTGIFNIADVAILLGAALVVGLHARSPSPDDAP